MTTYLWVMGVLCALGFLGNLIQLCTRDIPQRTPKTVAWNLILNVIFAAWAFALLMSN